MLAHRVVPILNVSNIRESFAWFEKLGWKKGWDWGDPPCSGHCELFLCEIGQGGRGRSDVKTTFGPDGDEADDQGCLDADLDRGCDAAYRHCLAQEIEIAFPPADMPWGVREMHVRHRDGRVLRLSQSIHTEPQSNHLTQAAAETSPPVQPPPFPAK